MAYPQEAFKTTVLLPGSLVYGRRDAVARNTLFYQLDVLKKTGRYDCFKLEWKSVYSELVDWPVPKHLFWDSDIGKWIEGACYVLHDHPSGKVEQAIRELVSMIRNAQHPDGYLNLHYTVVEPGKRFTNLRDMHELYNAGHLIEAALAHQAHFKNDDLMGPMLRYVDLLARTFGADEDKLTGYPGHPEIELALLRLYNRTGDPKHLNLALYFVTERGNSSGKDEKHYFDYEREKRGDDPYKRPAYHTEVGGCKWYYQAHLPIIDQPTIEGHSVRAMYLLTAAADLARLEVFPKEVIYRLWNNMVNAKMYVTGGIGSIKQYEGFGPNYFLPQGTDEGGCYAETCAAIGVMMLAQRILQYDLDRKFGDVMELAFYNAVLTAMSADGKSFTYVNQLASSDSDLNERCDWFTVACCPPNMLRFLGQISGYIYSVHDEAIDVHLYIPSDYRSGPRSVRQESNYPWDGNIKFTIEGSGFGLRLRIPAFATAWNLEPAAPGAEVKQGYLQISEGYTAANRTFTLSLPIKPRIITSHPLAGSTLSLARGPLVYCVEDVDNEWVKDHFNDVRIRETSLNGHKEQVLEDGTISIQLFTDLSRVSTFGFEQDMDKMPYGDVSRLEAVSSPIDRLMFVPYYYRANRKGRGQCRVGLRR